MRGQRKAGDGVECDCPRNELAVEIVLILAGNVAHAERGISALGSVPGKARGDIVPRGLSGAQPIQGQRRAARADNRVGETVAGGKADAAEINAGVDLDAAAANGIDIWAHAVGAACGDEADSGECAGSLTDGDIRYRIREPIVEQGNTDAR